MTSKQEFQEFLRRWGGYAEIFRVDFNPGAAFYEDLKKVALEEWYETAKYERQLTEREQVIWTVSKSIYAEWFYGTRNKSTELIRANLPSINNRRSWIKDCSALNLHPSSAMSKFRREMERLEISPKDIDAFIESNQEKFPPLDQSNDESAGGRIPRFPPFPSRDSENRLELE